METLRILAFVAAVGACLSGSPAPAQTRFTTLYSTATDAIGALASPGGVIYAGFDGPTPTGSNCGGVLELQPPTVIGGAWSETVLYTFAEANDACDPSWGPVVGAGGVLYGSTSEGGAYGGGTFYELQPPASPGETWTESVLYSFGAPGVYFGAPTSEVIPGPSGSYYFLTGGYSDGALVQMRPPAEPGGVWTATLLYSFTEDDGWRGLAAGPHGVLYGTAPYGGTAPGQLGEVFQLTPPAAAGGAWTETVIHNFGYGGAYAGNPNSLTVASDGTIYGTTYGYDLIGDRGMGSVFELTPPASPDGRWSYTVLQDFGGYHHSPGLILRDGNLYGAVATALQAGNIFEMQPPSTPGDAWTTTYLHQFTDLVPYVDLMDKNGALYGVALTETGEPSLHTIFQLATK